MRSLIVEHVNIALELIRNVPALFRILGIVAVTLIATLPLLKSAHPGYILAGLVSVQLFVAFLLPILISSSIEDSAWLDDANLGCVLLSGLNPQRDDFLAVRDGPGTDFTKITQRYTHQKLWAHGKTFGWLKVRFIEKGQRVEGWVFRRYTTSTSCA
ncbi:hypothetical protein OO25_00820 [Phaeobacter sp. S60]|nr:hypothetical protein OO25_00820 [Phaeobacter sp. S60]